MEEIIKKIEINTKYVEEEIIINIKCVENYNENIIVIDSGALISQVSLT